MEKQKCLICSNPEEQYIIWEDADRHSFFVEEGGMPICGPVVMLKDAVKMQVPYFLSRCIAVSCSSVRSIFRNCWERTRRTHICHLL
jgi:hypothetical protein